MMQDGEVRWILLSLGHLEELILYGYHASGRKVAATLRNLGYECVHEEYGLYWELRLEGRINSQSIKVPFESQLAPEQVMRFAKATGAGRIKWVNAYKTANRNADLDCAA